MHEIESLVNTYLANVHTHIYTNIYLYIQQIMHMYIYIYIHRQRVEEEEGERQGKSQRIYDKMLTMYRISYQLNFL